MTDNNSFKQATIATLKKIATNPKNKVVKEDGRGVHPKYRVLSADGKEIFSVYKPAGRNFGNKYDYFINHEAQHLLEDTELEELFKFLSQIPKTTEQDNIMNFLKQYEY